MMNELMTTLITARLITILLMVTMPIRRVLTATDFCCSSLEGHGQVSKAKESQGSANSTKGKGRDIFLKKY